MTEVAEIVDLIDGEAEELDAEGDEVHESARLDNGPVVEPLASEPVDVITFDENQEFRRVRPRRNVRIPARYL